MRSDQQVAGFVLVVEVDEPAGRMTIKFDGGRVGCIPTDVLDHPECQHMRPPKIGDQYPWSAKAGSNEIAIHFAKGRRA